MGGRHGGRNVGVVENVDIFGEPSKTVGGGRRHGECGGKASEWAKG